MGLPPGLCLNRKSAALARRRSGFESPQVHHGVVAQLERAALPQGPEGSEDQRATCLADRGPWVDYGCFAASVTPSEKLQPKSRL